MSNFINTGRTNQNIIRSALVTETLTFGNPIQVDFVNQSLATVEATAPRSLRTRTWNGRKTAQMTAGM